MIAFVNIFSGQKVFGLWRKNTICKSYLKNWIFLSLKYDHNPQAKTASEKEDSDGIHSCFFARYNDYCLKYWTNFGEFQHQNIMANKLDPL